MSLNIIKRDEIGLDCRAPSGQHNMLRTGTFEMIRHDSNGSIH